MGGQSVPKFDYDMAKGVAKSFIKEYGRNLKLYTEFVYHMDELNADKLIEDVKERLREYAEQHDWHIIANKSDIVELTMQCIRETGVSVLMDENSLESVYNTALEQLDKETHQAMEALVHNLNTMQCLPADETIWVYDIEQSEYSVKTMKEVYDTFKKGKYAVISVNNETGIVELKDIVEAIYKGKAYTLCKTSWGNDKAVRTTETHELITEQDGKIVSKYPTECKTLIGVKDVSNAIKGAIVGVDADKLAVKTQDIITGEFDVYDISVQDNENFLTGDGIFVHNCRAGAQVPFSSINLGTDISEEGRMVTKNLLLAMEEGLGNGETPIFPIVIFKVKDGVNYEEGTPNHDLLELSLRVTAKRMFPKNKIGACA
mgnify:CR=1 FL=1